MRPEDRRRLVELAAGQKGGVTGVTGVTPAAPRLALDVRSSFGHAGTPVTPVTPVTRVSSGAPSREPRSLATVWKPEDWLAYFNERAAVREFDGRMSRSEAERHAFEDTVAQWMALHPAPPTEVCHGCAHCGLPSTPDDPLLPILAADHGHTWIHDHCHARWLETRRAIARTTLQQLGVSGALGANCDRRKDERGARQ